MNKKVIAKQLELYSNSIIAFIVFQSLAFCYNFGTSDKFNSILKDSIILSWGLAIMFFIAYLLAVCANRFICQKLLELSEEYSQIVKAIYRRKCVVIILFGVLQFFVISFAILPHCI